MILRNLLSVGRGSPLHIRLTGTQISEVTSQFISRPDNFVLNFNDALVLPGLINSHDHLDFNLYPMLGNQIYSNYTEWGRYIHTHHQEEISKVLKVPLQLREEWGIYKNLLSGVTTVVNHGARLSLKQRLITVFEDLQCLHSVKFERRWRWKLNQPFKSGMPLVIHTGEGRDTAAALEINELLRWNLLSRKLVGVHAVAMSATQASKFHALVWCPESNLFLLNQSADITTLKKYTDVLFGTDSTLTSSWNIWEHLRLARRIGGLTDEELYQSLNGLASWVWGINKGVILPGADADLVIADSKGQNSMDAFFGVDPKDILLVLQQGEIRLFDATILPQLKGFELEDYSKIYIEGVCKYVQGDLPSLINKIRALYPEAVFPVEINTGQ